LGSPAASAAGAGRGFDARRLSRPAALVSQVRPSAQQEGRWRESHGPHGFGVSLDGFGVAGDVALVEAETHVPVAGAGDGHLADAEEVVDGIEGVCPVRNAEW